MTKKKYKIELMDNGWVLRDMEACAHQVCQEKETDERHNKFRKYLGDWLYEDIEHYMETNSTNIVEITFQIRDAESKKGGKK